MQENSGLIICLQFINILNALDIFLQAYPLFNYILLYI